MKKIYTKLKTHITILSWNNQDHFYTKSENSVNALRFKRKSQNFNIEGILLGLKKIIYLFSFEINVIFSFIVTWHLINFL